MWIWYLLLGSGSGSRTVGEYLKQAGTKVSGVFLGVFFVTEPIRSAPRSGWEKGGMQNSLKCGGWCCEFSFLLLDEFKLVDTLRGRADFTFHFHRVGTYFLPTN